MATLKIGGFWECTGSISWNLVLKAQSKPQTSLKDLPGRFAPAQWPVAPDPELTTPTLHGWYEVGDEVGDIGDIANKSMHEKIANKFNVLQKTAKKLLNQIRNWQISSLILSHPQGSSTVALRSKKENLEAKNLTGNIFLTSHVSFPPIMKSSPGTIWNETDECLFNCSSPPSVLVSSSSTDIWVCGKSCLDQDRNRRRIMVVVSVLFWGQRRAEKKKIELKLKQIEGERESTQAHG